MDTGILKAIALFVPVVGFIVWQIVRLSRDPELSSGRGEDRESTKPRHTERQ